MPAAIRYETPTDTPNNVLDARLSPDYDFNTPTPLRPRVLEYEDVIVDDDDDDDLRALREAEAEQNRRLNDPHWGLEEVEVEHESLPSSENESTRCLTCESDRDPIIEEPDDDCIFVRELTRQQAQMAAAWSCVRAAPTNDIFHVIDICYEVLEERGVDLGF